MVSYRIDGYGIPKIALALEAHPNAAQALRELAKSADKAGQPCTWRSSTRFSRENLQETSIFDGWKMLDKHGFLQMFP